MGFLSLRGVISGLSSAFVAIVAIITLSITLTTSLAALRNIGKSHAGSLLANANLKTAQLFDEPATALDVLKNFTLSAKWSWPSDDPTTFSAFFNVHRSLFLESKFRSAGIITYFFDNTRIGIEHDLDYPQFYSVTSLIPAPYSIGGMDFQATKPIAMNRSVWDIATHQPPAEDSPAWNGPKNVTLLRNSSFWSNTLMAGTLGATATVVAGVYLVQRTGAGVINYVPCVAPLYASGSRLGKANVFGITIASLYSDEVANFLTSVGGTPNTNAFAVDQLGFLIASSMLQVNCAVLTTYDAAEAPSTLRPGCASTGSTAGAAGDTTSTVYVSCRTHASKYPFAPLQAVAASENFLTVENIVELLTIGSDVWYAAVARVPLRYPGMTVQLALLLPEADVIGDVVQGRNLAIGITCGVFVVVAVLSFVLISLLLHPLSDVSNRMILAAALEDDTSERDVSAMAEVQSLQEAYYAMNDELNRIKSFVPQSLLAQRQRPEDLDDAHTTGLDTSISETRNVAHDNQSVRGSLRSASRLSSARKSSNSRQSPVMASLGTATNIAAHSVSVLVMNLTNFTPTVNERPRDDVIRCVGDLVSAVATEVRANNGVLHSFHGDHFVVTYNAVRACGAHARLAALTGMKLTKLAPSNGLGLTLRAGVATGKCLVGNLGSNDMKVFNTIGPAFMQASVLERMTRLYGSGCQVLAPKRTCLDIATHVRFRYVDIVKLPGLEKPTLIAALTGESRASNLHRVTDGNDSEWLYVVGRNVDADSLHNEAFVALEAGRPHDAQRIVSGSPLNVSGSSTTDSASTTTPRTDLDVNVGLSADEIIDSRFVNDVFFELLDAALASSNEAPSTHMGPFYQIAYCARGK